MTGKAKIGGADYRVAAWKKTTRNGDEYWSLAFSDPNAYQPAKREKEETARTVAAVYDDEIPFRPADHRAACFRG
jgi:hypothetical protein